jgi:hypothetical protein
MKTNIKFSTSEYQVIHGHTPRGRGSWAFQISMVDGNYIKGSVYFSSNMTLTDAY